MRVSMPNPGKMAAVVTDDILKYILFNENVSVFIQTSPKFVPKGPVKNMSALAHVMA